MNSHHRNRRTSDEIRCFLMFLLDKVEDVYYREAEIAVHNFCKDMDIKL